MQTVIPRPETKQELQAFVDKYKESSSQRNYSIQLGVSRATVQSWLLKATAIGIKVPNLYVISPLKLDIHKVKEAGLRDAVKQAHSDNKELKAQLESAEKHLSVYDALAKSGAYRINTYTPKQSNAVVVAVASDWHCGEAVDPSDIPGGRNIYNPEIFQERAKQFFQRSVYLTDSMARGVAKVDTMVLALLGDLMTGHLHDDQKESNHLNPMEEVLLLEEVISGGLEYLLSKGNFNKIIVPCCHGNHARTTEKMRAKTSADTSYEVLLYKHLAKRWGKEKRLDWQIAMGHHSMLKLWDYTIRFHHGDAVNYGGGVGGITIPLRKAIAGWDSVQRADLSVCGHFHQFTDGGDCIVNGSLVGYSAYALRVKARYEPPQQAFFMIDQQRGKTMTARIFTDYMPPAK